MPKLLRIIEFPGSDMAGISETYPLTALKAEEVWQRFMPRLGVLENMRADRNLYAVQEFHPNKNAKGPAAPETITLWAAVPLKPGISSIPAPLEELSIPAGTYAVFLHKGPAAKLRATLQEIFQDWMPASGYASDARPHLQVMDPSYKGHLHPEAEEEVWVPVRRI